MAEHLTSFWYRGPRELGNGHLRNEITLDRVNFHEDFTDFKSNNITA